MLFLGVDPALTGAAVLLDAERRVWAGFFWRPMTRAGARVWSLSSVLRRDAAGLLAADAPLWATRSQHPGMSSIGEAIRELLRGGGVTGYQLAAENAVVGRGVATSLVVARNSGRLVGPLETISSGREAEWVEAVRWRALLLGLSVRTNREEAKRQSLAMMPARIRGLQDAIRLLGDADDITDAAGVAEWGLINSSQGSSGPPGLDPPQKKKRARCSPPGASSGRKPAARPR